MLRTKQIYALKRPKLLVDTAGKCMSGGYSRKESNRDQTYCNYEMPHYWTTIFGALRVEVSLSIVSFSQMRLAISI